MPPTPFAFARLTVAQRAALLSCYCEDISAARASRIVGVNRKSVNQWYSAFRNLLVDSLEGRPSNQEAQDNYFTKFVAHRKRLYFGVSRMNEFSFLAEAYARYKRGVLFKRYLESLIGIKSLLEL